MPGNTLLFRNGFVIFPDRVIADGAVFCRDGRIAAVGKNEDVAAPDDAKLIDAEGGYISPSFPEQTPSTAKHTNAVA